MANSYVNLTKFKFLLNHRVCPISPHLLGDSIGPSDFTRSESCNSEFMVHLSKCSRPPSVGEKADLAESRNRFSLGRYSTFIKSFGRVLA